MENTKTWAIDITHSEVQFKVKHLVITTVTGHFRSFSGQLIASSDDFNGAKASFTIDTQSVDTNQTDRDNHLRSADFFDVAQYPQLTFEGVLHNVKGNQYTLDGQMTIKGQTKAVQLDVTLGGVMTDPWGHTKAGFEIEGKINRKDFGLNWNVATEAGGVLVSDEVRLQLSIQLA